MTPVTLDGIGLEILWGRLTGVADEMWTTVRRTAVSTVIGAAQDFGCEVLAADGSSLAHATRSMPAFNMVMPALTRAVMQRFPAAEMRAGDVFVTNDPWICCGHLDDIAVVSPVVHDGAVIAFAATAAHASSIGGALARHRVGDLYEEGLQIPITRLRRAGEDDATAWAFIAANVRTPEMVLTDVEAEIAANQVGVDRVLDLVAEYDLTDLVAVTAAVQDASERAMRTAIERVPDGDHHAALVVETAEGPIDLAVAITIAGSTLSVDYAGCGPEQLGHGLNCPLEYVRAHTVYSLQCLLAPDVPANEGTIRSLRITAPERSVVNCRPPASVGNRMRVGWHLHRLLFAALEDALPDRVQAGNGLMHMVRLHATGPAGSPGDVHLIVAGGRGAGRGIPGRGRDCFPSSARNVPLEELEARAPVLFTRRALRPDLAGAGAWPGAAGQEVAFLRAPGFPGRLTAFVDADHLHEGPAGVRGGGRAGRFVALHDGEVLAPEVLGATGVDVAASGGGLRLHVPGGGGYGAPAEQGVQPPGAGRAAATAAAPAAAPAPAIPWARRGRSPEELVAAWIAEYRRAWVEHDADGVAEIFTEHGVYRSTAFREPHVGREAIRRYWREEPGTHDEIDLRFGTPVVEGRRAAVEWWLQVRQSGEQVTGPGCLVLRFDADGRCEELREYWEEAPGRRDPPPGWGR